MIKSEILEHIEPGASFPLMARNIHSGFIVLFTAPCVGMIVLKATGSNDLGFYRKEWVECFDNECWSILPNGFTVALTQS